MKFEPGPLGSAETAVLPRIIALTGAAIAHKFNKSGGSGPLVELVLDRERAVRHGPGY